MSRRILKVFSLILISIFIITNNPFVSEAYTNTDFKIGVYWPPVVAQTNAIQYDYLQEANINWVINTHATDLSTVAINNTILDLCNARGMKAIVADSRFKKIYDNVATDSEIDAMADDYKNNPALGGYYVMDEPFTNNFTYIANANNRFLLKKTNAVNYINLLPINPTEVETEISPTLAMSQSLTGSGYFVQSTNPLGQTFMTPSDCNYIDSVELNIDVNTWGNEEAITLKLWDSPSKTTLVAASTLTSNNNSYPRFEFKTAVSPSTTYYWELVHNGSGDNSVGWVTCSTMNAYSNGTAYVNGTAVSGDFYFKVYKGSQIYPVSEMAQLSTGSGYFLASTNSLGQSFYTPANCSNIDFIELYIDSSQWESGETMTLTLWNSPAKTTRIASSSLTSTNNGNYPRFPIKAAVSPITSYYWELTHNGGGDNSVGLVSCSASDVLYGAAYENGTPKSNDFYFNIYKSQYTTSVPSFDESGALTNANPILSLSQTLEGNGSFITSTNPIGQTFTTPVDCSYIDYIELHLDNTNWSSNEALVLTLWNSPAKTQQIASCTLVESRNGTYPRFPLNTSVIPNTSYYFELAHNGGGDNSIGWVCRSTTDVYSGGNAYENSLAMPYDFYFRIYKDRSSKDKSVNQTVTGNGSFVSISSNLGQTFRTPATLDRVLQYIELNIGTTLWSTDEFLTLTIYDSTLKQQVLGRTTLKQSFNSDRPRFYIWANLQPGTTYYFELTHNGGGDNSVGWVCHSNTDVYNDGSAYVNGTAQNKDLYFRTVYSSRYQDYMEEFVDTVGASNLGYLCYDQYPMVYSRGINTGYYRNKELIRAMGLKKGVFTASFLQSFGIPSSYRRPNENELRLNVYTSIAYGAKALFWFNWWTPTNQVDGTKFDNGIIDPNGNKTDLFTPVKNLNGEVMKLGPKLMSLTSQAVYHSGAVEAGSQSVPSTFFWKPTANSCNVLISYFKNAANRKYIMVVNKSCTDAATFSFEVNPKPTAVTEVSKTTGLEVSTNYNSITGLISQQLLPGEGRLYALPSGY